MRPGSPFLGPPGCHQVLPPGSVGGSSGRVILVIGPLRADLPKRSFHQGFHPGSPALRCFCCSSGVAVRCVSEDTQVPALPSQSLRTGRLSAGPAVWAFILRRTSARPSGSLSTCPLRDNPNRSVTLVHPLRNVVQLGDSLALSQPPLRKTNLLAICHLGRPLAEPSSGCQCRCRAGYSLRITHSRRLSPWRIPCGTQPVGYSPALGELPLQAVCLPAAVTLAHPFRDVGQSATVSPSGRHPLRRTTHWRPVTVSTPLAEHQPW